MRFPCLTLIAAAAMLGLAPAAPAQTPDTVAADSIPDAPAPEREARNTAAFTFTSDGYNRVEGLPILFGPVVETKLGTARLRVSALGIIRSADTFRMDSDNLGHDVTVAALFEPAQRTTLSVRTYDIVDAVEDWQIPRDEAGLAAFFFRSDFRDHYSRQGTSVSGTYAASRRATLSASYARERWGSREVRDVLTVFRNGKAWRPNPTMDAGLFHIATAGIVYDTRNDPRRPATGWLVRTDYEFGTGRVDQFGATSGSARANFSSDPKYGRLFVDARRYLRLSPTKQLNARVVVGGWLHGNELPLQRRLSVSGLGTVPGIDFREPSLGPDVGQCSMAPAPSGDPAQCERALLAQLEYRIALPFRPGSIIGRTVRIRSRAFTLNPTLVIFADAGRGWLLEPRPGNVVLDAPLVLTPPPPTRDLIYSASAIPPFGTFRTDIGVGVDLGLFGIYAAKSLSESGEPINVFLRARRRF